MSFILNALQKSETERREKEQAPNLLAVQSQAESEAEPKNAHGLWQVLSVALLIGVFVLGYTLLRQHQSQPSEAVQSSAPIPTATNLSKEPSGQPSLAELSANSQNQPSEPKGSRLAISLPIAPETSVSKTQEHEVKTHEKAIVNPDITGLYQPSTDAKPKQSKQNAQPLTEDQRELAERAQRLKAEMAEPLVPAIHNMPIALQNRLPKMVYSAHIYSSDADSGFAIINDRRRYRGDQIAPGLLVLSVISNGVVLTFEGYTFRLDAMKNWPLE